MDNDTRDKVINALVREWEYLIHDDCEIDDPTPEEYRQRLLTLSDSQLLDEIDITEDYSLERFLEYWAHD